MRRAARETLVPHRRGLDLVVSKMYLLMRLQVGFSGTGVAYQSKMDGAATHSASVVVSKIVGETSWTFAVDADFMGVGGRGQKQSQATGRVEGM